MQVGIRELKAHLSEYITKARNGEPIVVTDRGRPVVRLAAVEPAPKHDDLPPKWRALIDSGKMVRKEPITRDMLPKPLPPIPGVKSLAELVVQERDEAVRRYEWARDYRSE